MEQAKLTGWERRLVTGGALSALENIAVQLRPIVEDLFDTIDRWLSAY